MTFPGFFFVPNKIAAFVASVRSALSLSFSPMGDSSPKTWSKYRFILDRDVTASTQSRAGTLFGMLRVNQMPDGAPLVHDPPVIYDVRTSREIADPKGAAARHIMDLRASTSSKQRVVFFDVFSKLDEEGMMAPDPGSCAIRGRNKTQCDEKRAMFVHDQFNPFVPASGGVVLFPFCETHIRRAFNALTRQRSRAANRDDAVEDDTDESSTEGPSVGSNSRPWLARRSGPPPQITSSAPPVAQESEESIIASILRLQTMTEAAGLLAPTDDTIVFRMRWQAFRDALFLQIRTAWSQGGAPPSGDLQVRYRTAFDAFERLCQELFPSWNRLTILGKRARSGTNGAYEK